MAYLREHPGASAYEIACAIDCTKTSLMRHIKHLRQLPLGHKDRVRISYWYRTGDRGPWSMGFEFHASKGNSRRPTPKSNAKACKDWWAKNRAKRALTRSTIRGPRMAQGGAYGIWGGLL